MTSTDADTTAQVNATTAEYSLVGDAISGLTLNSDGSWSFDASGTAYQDLSEGDTRAIDVNYLVTDDQEATGTATFTITVTGTNDGLNVTTSATDLEAKEDGATVTGTFVAKDIDANDSVTYSVDGLAATGEGSVGIDENGVYTYNPGSDFQTLGANESTTVTFDVTATSDSGETVTESVTITVTGTNDGLNVTTSATDLEAKEDGATVTGTFVAKDIDANDSVTYSVDGLAATGEGSVGIDENGVYTYNPGSDFQTLGANESTTVTFDVTATSDSGETVTESVTITVTGTNDGLNVTTSATDLEAKEDGATVTGTFVAKDIDANDSVTYSVDGLAATGEGSVGIDENGVYTYNPGSDFQTLGANESTTVTFDVTATSDSGETVTESVTITVTGTNDGLNVTTSATDLEAKEDGATVTGTFVAKDIDANDSVTYSVDGLAATGEGSVGIDENGVYTYNPGSDFQTLGANESTTVTFDVTATSDSGETVTESVTITVTGTNDGLNVTTSATDLEAKEDGATVTGTFVAKDIDANDSVTYSVDGLAATGEGSVGIDENGVYTYNPGSDFQTLGANESTTVTFDVTATSDSGETVTESVTITVTGTNDGLNVTTSATDLEAKEDGATVTGTFVAKDIDANDSVTYSVDGLAATGEGSVGIDENGVYTYNPGSDFQTLGANESTTVTFDVTATSDSGETVTESVTITVTGTNDGLNVTTSATDLEAKEDGATVTGTFVAKDIDANDSVTYSVDGLAATGEGSVGIDENGVYTYNPGSDFQTLGANESTTVTFDVTATSDSGETVTESVTITVTGTNDGLNVTTSATDLEAKEDGATVTGTFVAKDIDANDSVTYSVDGLAATGEGSVGIDENGVYTYNPGSDFQTLGANESTTVTFDVTATSDSGETVTESVTITVTGTNDGLNVTTSATDLEAKEDGATVTGTFVAKDIDANDSVTYSVDGLAATGEGSVGIDENGVYTYNPGSDFQTLGANESTTVTFDVTATSDSGETVTESVTITVTGTNDGLNVTTSATDLEAKEDGATVTGTFVAKDIDANDSVTYSVDGLAATGEGSVGIDENGVYTYNPGSDFQTLGANESTTVTFDVTATSDSGETVTESVTITVTGTNDGLNVTTSATDLEAKEDGATVTGTFVAKDIDANDSVTYSVDGLAATGEGSVGIDENGVYTYNPGSDFQTLGANESTTVTFDVTATSDSGETVTESVTMRPQSR